MTSSMELPQSGGLMSAGDEFFENQIAGWPLWSFSTSKSDEQNKTGAYSDRREHDEAQCSTGPSEEDHQSDEGPAPLQDQEPGFTQPTEDIFLSQFSDDEMRRMDTPFQALDMFPDSMHRLLSYENMFTGVLTGSEEGHVKLEHHGVDVDAMDTCGFPLFSIDPDILSDPQAQYEDDKAGMSTEKRSRSISDAESTPGYEALVLEELEDVVFQLTKRTRICYRDAFYRLAESSKANCSTANRTAEAGPSQSFPQPHGPASGFSTPGCHERETNPIDRTVMVLTMKLPQLHGNCFSGDWGAEAQSTTSWTTRA